MSPAPQPKEWVTVKEAAILVGRHVSQIYRWIQAGHLATRTDTTGVTEVMTKALLRIESAVRRGRPRGKAGTR